MKRLDEKVALVTGGARGIGRAIALALAGEGASVTVNYRESRHEAESLVDEIRTAGGEATSHRADVTDAGAVEGMIKTVLDAHGRIDVLVNNAGIIRDALLLEMDEEGWRSVLDTNLGGIVHCTRAVVMPMVMQRGGSIINLSSVAGEKGGKGQSNYAASKGAVNAFTRAMAAELGPKRIRVNAVAPGFIRTEMTRAILEEGRDFLRKHVPLRRAGTPEEVASLAVYLASDEAAYITGQVIRVDGGLL